MSIKSDLKNEKKMKINGEKEFKYGVICLYMISNNKIKIAFVY